MLTLSVIGADTLLPARRLSRKTALHAAVYELLPMLPMLPLRYSVMPINDDDPKTQQHGAIVRWRTKRTPRYVVTYIVTTRLLLLLRVIRYARGDMVDARCALLMVVMSAEAASVAARLIRAISRRDTRALFRLMHHENDVARR